MRAPTKDEVRALASLKSSGNKDFVAVMNWINDSMIRQSIENNHERDDTQLRFMQGRNQELIEILENYKEAENNLKAMQKPQPSTPS